MMPLLVTGLLTLAAMGCLALAMERHFHACLGRAATPRQRKDLRLAGWFLLAGAIALSIRHWGASIGPVIVAVSTRARSPSPRLKVKRL